MIQAKMFAMHFKNDFSLPKNDVELSYYFNVKFNYYQDCQKHFFKLFYPKTT